MYGFKQWDAHNGFTLAQASFNAVETAAYAVYLYLVYRYGREEERQGRGAPRRDMLGRLKALGDSRTVEGELAVWVVLLGYSTSFLTFTKTVLYWLNEVFSGKSRGLLFLLKKKKKGISLSAIRPQIIGTPGVFG